MFSNMIFNSGSTNNAAKCMALSIPEDNVLSGDKILTVTIINSDPGVRLQNSLTSVTVSDNDG